MLASIISCSPTLGRMRYAPTPVRLKSKYAKDHTRHLEILTQLTENKPGQPRATIIFTNFGEKSNYQFI